MKFSWEELRRNPWFILAISILLVLVGQLLLVWQYNRLAQERLPRLEQQVQEQQVEFERRDAVAIAHAFFAARLAEDEQRAIRYLTERAVDEWERELFEFGGIIDYRIIQTDRLTEEEFRFHVEIYRREDPEQLEIITVIKILDEYYVDSVQIAG